MKSKIVLYNIVKPNKFDNIFNIEDGYIHILWKKILKLLNISKNRVETYFGFNTTIQTPE